MRYPKLLLIGTNSIHTYNYLELIKDYFDFVYVITDSNGEKYGVPYKNVNFSFSNPLKIIKSILAIKRILTEVKPDIIHIHQVGTHAWMALQANRKINIPVVVTAWGSDILTTPQKGYLYHKMVEHILNKAKHFTSDSVFMADEMNRIANKKLDTTIANFGINITITGEAKENWIYSNRAHHALYRIDEIIKAFSKFSTKTIANNWKLVIAGEGELTPTLKELSKQLGITKKVDFVGWLNKDQNSSFYQKARLYVSIPTSDATSISLLEAMASGCIPVVSDLPANAEWITDGINGVVVKNLAEDFLERALQLDYDLVKKTNSEIINRDGTREANRNKFVHLYDSILK